MAFVDVHWLRDAVALVDGDGGRIESCNDAFDALAAGHEASVWETLQLAPFIGSVETQIWGRWHAVRASRAGDAHVLVEVRDVHDVVVMHERYNAVLETSFDGFWDWKLKEDWEYMSPQFWRMFGYAPEEKEHKPSAWQELIFQEDLQEAMANLDKHVASRGVHAYVQKARYRHKDGHTVTVLCKGRVVEWDKGNGEALRMVGTHTDITILERKEQALRAQSNELDVVVNQMGVPVVGLDADGRVQDWNDAVQLLTGRARKDALGHPVSDLLVEGLPGLQQLQDLMRDAAHARRPQAEETGDISTNAGDNVGTTRRQALALALRGPGGAPVEFIATLLARTDSQGAMSGALLVGSDLTSLLEARAAAVAERERADAESGLNEFIAHEVRNPLTVAMSAARFLSSSQSLATFADASVQQSFAEDLNLLSTSLVYINELLANMLDLNKFAIGKGSLELAPLSLRDDVLAPVRAMLNRSMSGVALQMHCVDELWVRGDALRLKQIMVNLAKNAIKFVTVGYIRLSARRDPGGRFGDATVLLAVEDSGPGVPAAHRGALFQKYQESLDRLRQGTGIGLSLCKVLAGAMGGDIEYDPEYDSGVPGCPGARFEVTLPLPPCEDESSGLKRSTRRSAALQGDDRAASVLLKGAQCLVVDDEALVRAVVRRRLQALLGRDVAFAEAASAEAALELLARDPTKFELIVVDHYMPGTSEARNGAEFIRDARAMGAIRALILGCSANDVSAAHMQAGADAFVRKPLPSDTSLAQLLVDAARVPRELHLLVVDDEKLNRTMLCRLISAFAPDAHVLEAANAAEADKIVRTAAGLDAVFLDEHLGDGRTGSTMAAEIRARLVKAGRPVPVLISVSADRAAPGASGGVSPFDLTWSKPYPSMLMMKAALLRALQRRGVAEVN